MFGRSKKNKEQAQQPQQMQVSADALALLQAMQAGQQMQAQQQMMQQQQMMMQQQMPQQMPNQIPAGQTPPQPMMGQPVVGQPAGAQQPMAPLDQGAMSEQDLLAELAGSPPLTQQAPQHPAPQAPMQQMPPQMQAAPQQAMAEPQQMPNAQMPNAQMPIQAPTGQAGFAFAPNAGAMPTAEDGAVEQGKGKKKKLTREEKKQAAEAKKIEKERKKAEKQAAANEKKEEKKRQKKRKKLAKTRFSRARYLRESNGNAIAGVVLWIFVIILFIVAPFMLNTVYLIPQTNENLRIISEVSSLERSIVTNRPQIASQLEKRKQKELQVSAFTTSFINQSSAKELLEILGTELEDAGFEVEPVAVSPFPLQAQRIIGTSATFQITGNYLDWLRIRNNFVREQNAVTIPVETVEVDSETGLMKITAQIVLPSSR